MTEKSPPTETNSTNEAEGLQLSWQKKLLFGSVMSLFLVLGMEGLGRIAGLPSGALRTLSKMGVSSPEQFEKSVGMWRPNFKGRVSWPVEIAYDVEIDALGFRQTEPFPKAKSKDSYRILCLGDSTTFCVYVNNDETYPSQLLKRLKTDHSQVEVINAGAPAWSIADELRFLKDRALAVKPDCIIHMFCDNDPGGIVDAEGLKGEYAHQLRRLSEGLSLADMLRFHTAIGEMETRLHIFFKQMRGKKRHATFDPAAISKDQWQLYEEVYKELVAVCQREKIQLITVCFPQIIELEDKAERAETVVGRIAKRHKVPFIEIAPTFRAKEKDNKSFYNLPIDNHANAQGNALIASIIAEAMKARRLGPYQ